MRILVLDDEEQQLEFLKRIFSGSGIHCVTCTTVGQAWNLLQSEKFDVLVVDYCLSSESDGYNGSTFIKKIRSDSTNRNISIIMMTANRSLSPKIDSLQSGADYCLCKPVNGTEIITCIKNMTARQFGHPSNVIAYGDLALKTLSREFFVKGEKIPLTCREYEVVQSLVLRYGEYVPKEVVLRELYGDDFVANLKDKGKARGPRAKTVDVWVCKIRKTICNTLGLIPNDKRGSYIITSWGLGYKINGYPISNEVINIDTSHKLNDSKSIEAFSDADSIYQLKDEILNYEEINKEDDLIN